MISDDKKRDSPLAGIGPPGIARRYPVEDEMKPARDARAQDAREAMAKATSAKPRARSKRTKRAKGRVMKDKDDKPKPKKRGRPRSVGDMGPWESLGICRAKYYRDMQKAAGTYKPKKRSKT